MAAIDTAQIAGQVGQIGKTLAQLTKLVEAKVAANAPAKAAEVPQAGGPAAAPAAPADQNLQLKPGQAANVALEQPAAAAEAPQAGGPVEAPAAGDQSALLKELLGDLTKILGKLAALVQQLMAEGLGALTGGDQKADLTKPAAAEAGKGGPNGAPVQATGEPKWNNDGTYTVPTAGGPVTVPAGAPIEGYTFGPDNHYKDGAGKTIADPLKLTLDGTDAKLNTTDHVKIRKEDGTVDTMSGGLNSNEAWLVKDRDGKGVTKSGVVDGEDVFGDHQGKFKNAYDQLAKEYAGEVKTDAQGNKFIDLADPNSKAAKELKLMDKGGNLYTASDKLNKLYVSYADTNNTSADGDTSIREQSKAEYKDGHTAKTVDQWYTAI